MPKSTALKIVLVIGAVLGTMLLAIGGLVGGIALLTPENSPPPPPLVRQTIPTAANYYGTWKSADAGVTLKVSKDAVSWLKEKKSGTSISKESFEGTFVGIAPNGSIQMKMLVVSKTLAVSDPPHLDNLSGEWRMTVENEELKRSNP